MGDGRDSWKKGFLASIFGVIFVGMLFLSTITVLRDVSKFNQAQIVDVSEVPYRDEEVKIAGYIIPIDGVRYVGLPGIREGSVTRTFASGSAFFPSTVDIQHPFILESESGSVYVEAVGRSLIIEDIGGRVYISGRYRNGKFYPSFMSPVEKVGVAELTDALSAFVLGAFCSSLLFIWVWEATSGKKVITKKREYTMALIMLVLGILRIAVGVK